MPEQGYREYLFALVVHLLRYAAGVADELPNSVRKQTESLRAWHASYAAARTAQAAAAMA